MTNWMIQENKTRSTIVEILIYRKFWRVSIFTTATEYVVCSSYGNGHCSSYYIASCRDVVAKVFTSRNLEMYWYDINHSYCDNGDDNDYDYDNDYGYDDDNDYDNDDNDSGDDDDYDGDDYFDVDDDDNYDDDNDDDDNDDDNDNDDFM